MKPYRLLPCLLALASCNSSPTEGTHSAVDAYLTQHLNDPASYEAVRWGKPIRFTRQDSAGAAAQKLEAEYDSSAGKLSIAQRARISHSAIVLGNVTDTTRVGTYLTHAFRAKNKLGATVLDSAQFVVYNNGQVQQL